MVTMLDIIPTDVLKLIQLYLHMDDFIYYIQVNKLLHNNQNKKHPYHLLISSTVNISLFSLSVYLDFDRFNSSSKLYYDTISSHYETKYNSISYRVGSKIPFLGKFIEKRYNNKIQWLINDYKQKQKNLQKLFKKAKKLKEQYYQEQTAIQLLFQNQSIDYHQLPEIDYQDRYKHQYKMCKTTNEYTMDTSTRYLISSMNFLIPKNIGDFTDLNFLSTAITSDIISLCDDKDVENIVDSRNSKNLITFYITEENIGNITVEDIRYQISIGVNVCLSIYFEIELENIDSLTSDKRNPFNYLKIPYNDAYVYFYINK